MYLAVSSAFTYQGMVSLELSGTIALSSPQVEFVYCIFSETVRRLEKDGLMVVRSCEVCFSKRVSAHV